MGAVGAVIIPIARSINFCSGGVIVVSVNLERFKAAEKSLAIDSTLETSAFSIRGNNSFLRLVSVRNRCVARRARSTVSKSESNLRASRSWARWAISAASSASSFSILTVSASSIALASAVAFAASSSAIILSMSAVSCWSACCIIPCCRNFSSCRALASSWARASAALTSPASLSLAAVLVALCSRAALAAPIGAPSNVAPIAACLYSSWASLSVRDNPAFHRSARLWKISCGSSIAVPFAPPITTPFAVILYALVANASSSSLPVSLIDTLPASPTRLFSPGNILNKGFNACIPRTSTAVCGMAARVALVNETSLGILPSATALSRSFAWRNRF